MSVIKQGEYFISFRCIDNLLADAMEVLYYDASLDSPINRIGANLAALPDNPELIDAYDEVFKRIEERLACATNDRRSDLNDNIELIANIIRRRFSEYATMLMIAVDVLLVLNDIIENEKGSTVSLVLLKGDLVSVIVKDFMSR